MGTALVTGTSTGIGRTICEHLLARGMTVLALSRRPTAIDHPQLISVEVDLTDRQATCAVAAELAQHHAISTFVHNAGVIRPALLADVQSGDLDALTELHLGSAIAIAQAVRPGMRERGFGRIVMISSRGALGLATRSAYAATKAGIVQLSETLRSELAASGVDVTVWMTTFYTSNIAEYTRGPDADREKARSLVEMAPWSAEQVADELLLHVQRRRFYMVAPGQALFLWRFKRLAPERYLRLVPALFPKLEAKLIANAARRRVER